ncbi:MAG TPA: LON peptidase substrate-binding domain-containing protein [Acidimicrobiia bacterium]|nr:LON peptidase substrate-binding domain-containing protein [Acidimicrobiia bacterium]
MRGRMLPMFPLGTVLFPHAQLPLHVFEPRYRALAEACLSGDGEFGVVLIERGSEVGGGDTRFTVGTVARIVAAGRLPDGRYLLATEGTRRLRVREWLPDDPFPRADVELLDEPGPPADARSARDEVERLLKRVLAMSAELGDAPQSIDVTLDDDPAQAAFEAAAAAPIGPLDAQRLLELDAPGERLAQLETLLVECESTLELRLSGA